MNLKLPEELIEIIESYIIEGYVHNLYFTDDGYGHKYVNIITFDDYNNDVIKQLVEKTDKELIKNHNHKDIPINKKSMSIKDHDLRLATLSVNKFGFFSQKISDKFEQIKFCTLKKYTYKFNGEFCDLLSNIELIFKVKEKIDIITFSKYVVISIEAHDTGIFTKSIHKFVYEIYYKHIDKDKDKDTIKVIIQICIPIVCDNIRKYYLTISDLTNILTDINITYYATVLNSWERKKFFIFGRQVCDKYNNRFDCNNMIQQPVEKYLGFILS